MIAGDILLGLSSSGVHSHGFFFVRKILEKEKVGFHHPAPWDQSVTVGESLLTSTRIYVKPCLEAHKRGPIKGMAHITGGGLLGNVLRMLPDHLASEIDLNDWEVPEVFRWLRKAGNIAATEMARVFNNEIGMVLVVPSQGLDEAESVLRGAGEAVTRTGILIERTAEPCVLKNIDAWE